VYIGWAICVIFRKVAASKQKSLFVFGVVWLPCTFPFCPLQRIEPACSRPVQLNARVRTFETACMPDLKTHFKMHGMHFFSVSPIYLFSTLLNECIGVWSYQSNFFKRTQPYLLTKNDSPLRSHTMSSSIFRGRKFKIADFRAMICVIYLWCAEYRSFGKSIPVSSLFVEPGCYSALRGSMSVMR
jgi:hypothetical protein